jgi:hypothetical protein
VRNNEGIYCNVTDALKTPEWKPIGTKHSRGKAIRTIVAATRRQLLESSILVDHPGQRKLRNAFLQGVIVSANRAIKQCIMRKILKGASESKYYTYTQCLTVYVRVLSPERIEAHRKKSLDQLSPQSPASRVLLRRGASI